MREDYGVFVDVGGVDGSRHGVGDGRVGVGAFFGFASGALLASAGCAGFSGRSAVGIGGGLPVVGGLFGSGGALTGGAARVGGGRLVVPIGLDVVGGDVVGSDVVGAAQQFAGGPDAL